MILNIESALASATNGLAAFDSPRLEAEYLLAAVVDKPRSFFIAFPEKTLSSEQETQFHDWLHRRIAGEPLAYIVGEKEFWSLNLTVTPDVLIPRPETELLVEKVLMLMGNRETCKVADLGTGSGAIALALASERSNWQISATDNSRQALCVAEQNVKKHGLENILLYQGNWCHALPDANYDIIVSNPPYIEPSDPALDSDVKAFEPDIALLADDGGLTDIALIIEQAKTVLKPGGYLLLEHGYQQRAAVQNLLVENGYSDVMTYTDYQGHDRVTVGSRSKEG